MAQKIATVRRTTLKSTVASLSHDLKTPLQSLYSVAETLRMLSGGDNMNADAIRADLNDALDLLKCTYYLMNMNINRMVDFSRLNSAIGLVPQKDSVSLEKVIKEVTACVMNLQNRVPVEVTILPFLSQVCIAADESWLMDNILCLLSNAVKFTKSGSVHIGMQLFCKFQKSHTEFLKITVTDGGETLSKAELAKIFKPYLNMEKRDGGVGLGLHLLYHRVKASQGSCGVCVRPDNKSGTVFWFQIPFKRSAGAMQRTPSILNGITAKPKIEDDNSLIPAYNILPSGTRRIRVLVAEDSFVILKVVKSALSKAGFEVEGAEDGAAALELLKRNGVEFYDVLLTDLQMPKMDGFELMREIRKGELLRNLRPIMSDSDTSFCSSGASNCMQSQILIIAMSANGDSGIAAQATVAGADRFLPKPFKVEAFQYFISEFL